MFKRLGLILHLSIERKKIYREVTKGPDSDLALEKIQGIVS